MGIVIANLFARGSASNSAIEEVIMRERTRGGDLIVKSFEQWQYEGADGCTVPHADYCDWYVSHQGEHVVADWSTVMHDVVTPNFHKLSRQGIIVNSPMDKAITFTRNHLCKVASDRCWLMYDDGCTVPVWKENVEYRKGTRPSSVYVGDPTTDVPSPPSIDYQFLINAAVSKAHANVSLTDVQALVLAGEGMKTVSGLAAIFRRLIKIIKRIKRADIAGLRGELSPRELSDRYMELRYALRPLAYDVVGVIGTFSDYVRQRVTFRGYETDATYAQSTIPYLDDWGEGDLYWARHGTIVRNASRVVEVRAGVLAEITALSKWASWGMLDPFESVWELVPFSFIIDWFFNVGRTISSLTPNYGIKDLASWYTMTESVFRELSLTDTHGHAAPGNEIYDSQYLLFDIKDCYTSDLTITTTRVPNPVRSVVPTFSLKLDVFKLTDLVIIAQKLYAKDRSYSWRL